MYECVRIAPNRPKIQVYKNIINHKFIFNYHYNSAHWSDRFKSVAIKDPRTAGVRSLVGPNGSSEIFVIFYFRNFRFSLNPSSSPVLSVREFLKIFGLGPSWSHITKSFLVRSWSLDPGSCLVQIYLESFFMKLRKFLEEIKKVYGIFRRGWMWILNVRFNSNPFYKHAWPHSLYPINIQVENFGEEDSFTKWNRVVQIQPWLKNRGSQPGITTAWTWAANKNSQA